MMRKEKLPFLSFDQNTLIFLLETLIADHPHRQSISILEILLQLFYNSVTYPILSWNLGPSDLQCSFAYHLYSLLSFLFHFHGIYLFKFSLHMGLMHIERCHKIISYQNQKSMFLHTYT